MTTRKCIGCGMRSLKWAGQRKQYGRAIRAGLTPEEAEAIMPRCGKCTTQALRARLHRWMDEPLSAELAAVLNTLPDRVTRWEIVKALPESSHLRRWLIDWEHHRRSLARLMKRCGYAPIRNPDAVGGLWYIEGVRQVVYGRQWLPLAW
jgi:hypothetical protein